MMTNADLNPSEVLKALLSKPNRRDKAEKLTKLYDLCAAEYARRPQGARDLSIANMSRIAEMHGLFKARTIYNAQSADYATLIRAWEAYDGPRQARPNRTGTAAKDEKYAFLKKIEDAAVRSLCHMAFAERDRLKAELDVLKSQTILSIDMRPLGHAGSQNSTQVEPTATSMIVLTDSEREALGAAIDPDALARKSLRLGGTGEVLDGRNRFVFNPGFATGIAKILDVLVQS